MQNKKFSFRAFFNFVVLPWHTFINTAHNLQDVEKCNFLSNFIIFLHFFLNFLLVHPFRFERKNTMKRKFKNEFHFCTFDIIPTYSSNGWHVANSPPIFNVSVENIHKYSRLLFGKLIYSKPLGSNKIELPSAKLHLRQLAQLTRGHPHKSRSP